MSEFDTAKIVIYSITSNDDDGPETIVYLNQGEAQKAFSDLVKEAYKKWFHEDFVGDAQAAYDRLSEQVGFFDTIHCDIHECAVPWITTMLEMLREIEKFSATEHKELINNFLANIPVRQIPANGPF